MTTDNRAEEMLMNLPFAIDWVKFKGVDMVAAINFEATKKAGRPMLDMSYCMTQSMNNNVLFTTQFDKNKFHPSPLGEWCN